MFWKQLIDALIAWLTTVFGDWFKAAYEAIFKRFVDVLPEPIIRVGSAPDEIKKIIREQISALVSLALANRPIIRNVVLAIVRNIPDSFIDNLWDQIFASQIGAGEVPDFSSLPKSKAKVKSAKPVAVAAKVLAECKAEAGVA